MKHTSIALNMPCEFINITPVNPLISKCEIKVCYVSDKPNRNRSIITKDVAKEMANSLPGCPIVGYYNEAKEDFEEHNRVIEISNGKFEIKDTTRPYGFVDLNAKVWFQKFLDDGLVEREYLVTEGYIWTGVYPESERIISKGNNQSMELDEKSLKATWTKDDNGKHQFFIIHEALVSKLCILGEDCEPCFEGSQIGSEFAKIEFSFSEGFEEKMFSMLNELKELIKEGGAEVFTEYAVEIGDALWSMLYDHLYKHYPDGECCTAYGIEGIYEEGTQKFAILRKRSDSKYYRMDFSLTEETGFVPSEELVEVTKTYVPAEKPQFALEEVEKFEAEYAEKKKAEQKEDEKDEEEKCPKCGKPKDECECEDEEDEDKKKKYNLEEIEEYVALQSEYANLQSTYSELETRFNELQEKVNALEGENSELKGQVEPLKEFKLQAERKSKEDMINSFDMLTDEDKADVIANIDTYSLDDIEKNLSVICVRNRVSFNTQDENDKKPTTFSLGEDDDTSTPAWVKAVIETAKSRK